MEPGPFLLHCYYCFTFTCIIYILANYYLLPLDTLNPLFIANRWDWQPHRKLGKVLGCVVCRFDVAAGEKLHADKHLSGAIVRSVAKLAGINLRKCGSFSYWFDNLGFTTEGNFLLCSSYLPLGVPNWVPTTHHQKPPMVSTRTNLASPRRTCDQAHGLRRISQWRSGSASASLMESG
jgi:hypothetical protein